MAYEPTNWKSGDVVTSAKLNKIEAGIASGGVLVATEAEGTLNKTWQEIWDAVSAGKMCVVAVSVENETDMFPVISVLTSEGVYAVTAFDGTLYVSDSADGYPVVWSDEHSTEG